MRRLAVEAEPGAIGGNPEETIGYLADIAEADGADREEWLAKAAAAAGATRIGVTAGGAPRFAIVPEAVADADKVFELLMARARREIIAMLEARHTPR